MELTFPKMRHHRMMLCVLAVCNASSLAAAINLVIVLDPEDRISVRRGAALTALGLVYFVSLFELFNVAALLTGAGARFRRKHRLSCGDVLDISNKCVPLATAASLTTRNCFRHYFYSAYLRGGLGDCVFGFVYLMELSTPFVSLRGVLSRLRLKGSRAYLLNGLAMLLAFLLCRVLSLPYACLLYSRGVGLPYLEKSPCDYHCERTAGLQALRSLPAGCKLSIGILLLPQLYWFCLMSAGAVRVLAARS
ncbi:jg11124 [Pararge aegeria aegeria]|uniref:Jg11124 protein n=1 Tax=Pararge aegeria aegeria TaxID=348720 RepID=A0A8S4RM32_9NEOP|nr:jg11124 [Pararge aegeria aegeria]